MNNLHPFGPHFQRWRKRRGYSLKEAASDIVSPQFLSQFEKEQKSITIDKLSRLLMVIGVDIADFMMTYDGVRIEKFNRNYEKAMEDPEGYLEEIRPYYTDNSESLDLLKYCLKQIAQSKVLTLSPVESLPAYRIEQLLDLPDWNLLELETIFILVEQEKLTKSQVEQTTQIVLHLLEESITGKDMGGAHIVNIYNQLSLLTRLVRQLSRFHSYDQTLTTINRTRKLVKSIYSTDLMFVTILVRFDVVEVYTWLRMGELAKAQEGYDRVLDYINATIAYDANPQITESFIGYRTTFQQDFQRLLKDYQDKNRK